MRTRNGRTLISLLVSGYVDQWVQIKKKKSRWERDFLPVQTGPGAHQPPVKWVPGLSQGKVRPGRAADHSPPSSAAVMEE